MIGWEWHGLYPEEWTKLCLTLGKGKANLCFTICFWSRNVRGSFCILNFRPFRFLVYVWVGTLAFGASGDRIFIGVVWVIFDVLVCSVARSWINMRMFWKNRRRIVFCLLRYLRCSILLVIRRLKDPPRRTRVNNRLTVNIMTYSITTTSPITESQTASNISWIGSLPKHMDKKGRIILNN